jgi:large subunit ribosomal protein L25
MKSIALNAFPRSVAKRSGVKKLRDQGRVPAVIYGRNQPQNLEVNVKDIEAVIHQAHSEILLLDLSVDGGKRLALVKEIQHHPLSGQMLHIDLHEVAEDQKVTANVPVEPVGEAAGVKTGGGVLEHVLFNIKVRATPKNLPEVIHVDVSALEINKSLTLGEIKFPEGVEPVGKKELVVFSVAEPVSEVEEAAATAEAAPGAGEVEMIKEKKEGEEGAAPAAKAGEKAPAGKAEEKKGEEKKPAEKKK